MATHNIHLREQQRTAMGYYVPSSIVINQVAARLKHYVDVQRKEAGFDLGAAVRLDRYRLYQHPKSPDGPCTQSSRQYSLDNQIEAMLRLHASKADEEWNRELNTFQDRKQHVQRKIKKKIISFSGPEQNPHLSLRRGHFKQSRTDSYWDHYHLPPPDISQGEFTRLLCSAAKLIVTTTPEDQKQQVPSGRKQLHCSLPHVPKASISLKIPSSGQEANDSTGASQDETICIDDNESMNQKAELSDTHEEEVDYKITVHTGSISKSQGRQVLLITMVGESGRSKTLCLEKSSTNHSPFCAGQVDVFQMKAKDVGKVKYIITGIRRRDKSCRYYCRTITVRKNTDEVYLFPCNRWFASANTVVHGAPYCMEWSPVEDEEDTSKGLQNMKPKPDKLQQSSILAKAYKYDVTSQQTCEEVEILQSVSNDAEPTEKEHQSYGLKKETSSKAEINMTDPSALLNKNSSKPVRKCSTNGSSTQGSRLTSSAAENPCDDLHKSTTSDTSLQGEDNRDYRKDEPQSGKASIPASYIFFSLDIRNISTPDAEPVGHSWIEDSINSNYKHKPKLATPDNKAQIEPSSSSGTHLDEGINRNSSQFTLLQQILSDPAVNSSTASDSYPIYSSPEEQENAQITVSRSDRLFSEENIIPSADIGQTSSSQCQHSSPTTQTSGCPPEEDQGSFVSDTTLDEEYLFSDTSLMLSLSDENSENLSSQSEAEGASNRSADKHREGAFKPVQKTPTKVNSEMAQIFQKALDAVEREDSTKLKHMCEQHFFLLSSTDKEGRTLLHHAASRDKTAICQLLLDSTIGLMNIDRQDTFGKTALHYAVQNGSSGTIKVLVNNRANYDIPDGYSRTVLDAALQKLHEVSNKD
ncbi:uncharacterized protein LOC108701546 [Xenopus laevis]|uniref:Uncharacterized protein LOC108701546 n=2 Tax=Xenopus laevis TaxID=8355 RepID=A0A1L8EXM4_XENLA|nr:uncharacterized protein LOC108701546 [Xenopus laevis]OCT64107.1 hypothetical protein XELAEV_18045209mg [Xenopus laevis]